MTGARSKDRSGVAGAGAMILAAGLGTRMRPLTDTCPKPLIKVAGRALIDYTLDKITAAGITRLAVNMHYHASQIEHWASRQRSVDVTVCDERAELLETGGGVSAALAGAGCLGPQAFFVFNSDSFFLERPPPVLARMHDAFDAAHTDCLLLLARVEASTGYDGAGDFFMGPDTVLARRGDRPSAPYVYAGCYLASPQLFAGAPAGAFSMNVLWDRAIARGRLKGLVLDGLWLHVGTPQAIGLAEQALADWP